MKARDFVGGPSKPRYGHPDGCYRILVGAVHLEDLTMSKKTSFVKLTAIAAVLACGSATTAHAQISPQGPVKLNGYVSVNLNGIGVPIADFSCKVLAQGRTSLTAGNVINIESVQALNHASGMAPHLCATVDMLTLPWTLTIGAGPVQVTPVLQEYAATITGVSFDSQFVPGSGCQGAIAGTWIENSTAVPTPVLGDFQYPSYSRFVAQNVWMGTPNASCLINNLMLKVERPDAPRMAP